MTLRDEAIEAMRQEQDRQGWYSDKRSRAAALDGLLGWLRTFSARPVHPQLDNFQRYGRLSIEALCDLLARRDLDLLRAAPTDAPAMLLVPADAPSITVINENLESCAAVLGLHDHPLPAGRYVLVKEEE